MRNRALKKVGELGCTDPDHKRETGGGGGGGNGIIHDHHKHACRDADGRILNPCPDDPYGKTSGGGGLFGASFSLDRG